MYVWSDVVIVKSLFSDEGECLFSDEGGCFFSDESWCRYGVMWSLSSVYLAMRVGVGME